MSERESMPYDVVIVGAGPAGLSAAIRIKQKSPDTSVCILEKGSEVGAHILSGAVIDPKALDELIPDWRDQGCPLAEVPVNDNQHWVMTKTGKFNVPHFLTPGFMHNKGDLYRFARQSLPLAGRASRKYGRGNLPGIFGRRNPLQ
jgi:electron-transferring-flavoprotein dehydrogenase